MRGDILVIQEWHVKAGKRAAELILPAIQASKGKYGITVAGESGSGNPAVRTVRGGSDSCGCDGWCVCAEHQFRTGSG